MHEDGERSCVVGVVDGPLSGFLVIGVVGVFLDGHAEDLGELRPVAGGVALVDDPWRSLGEESEVVGRADEEEVGVFVP